MTHHLALPVTYIKHSAAFYAAALGALGYVRIYNRRNAIGCVLIDDGDHTEAVNSPHSPN